MQSFAGKVKNELCRVPVQRLCCARAEAYGVLLYGNTFSPTEVRLITESADFAARLPRLFQRAFGLKFDRLPEEERGKLIFGITDRSKLDRIINQQKNWKFSMSDINERQYWDRYQELYEEMITKTSKEISPWYIVPADNKWYTRYVVALITLEVLKKINPQFPKLAPEVQEQLEQFKKLISEVDIKSLEEIKNSIDKK